MTSRREFVGCLSGIAPTLLSAARVDRTGSIHSRLQECIDKKEIPGAVTLVATRSGISHFHAQGHADAACTIPLKKNAIFAIASMSKPVTGVAIMMLQDAGKLSIEDPVEKYVPELGKLRTASGDAAKVTVKHMMTHTSGMGEVSPQEMRGIKTLSELIPLYASKPVAFAPGSAWKYCQSGINTLGRIVEVVSGASFDGFLDKQLFGPLGMKNTGFYLAPSQYARLVHASILKDGKLADAPGERWERDWVTSHARPPLGNGGLYSTAEDYSRFTRMLLNGGEWKGRRLLSEAALKQMTSSHTGDLKAGFIPGSAWGLTVGIVREPQGVSAPLSAGTFGHGGAFGTQAWTDPVKGVSYILMIQRVGLPNSDASPMRQAFQEAAAA